MTKKNIFKVASLFCGCGGADLGIIGGFSFYNTFYPKHNCKIVYACDIDTKAIETYKNNFKASKVECIDICELDAVSFPMCDIIVGGFPCQSFSTANPKRDPFDERANLYKQMLRIIQVHRPKAFIAENVKGLVLMHKGAIFQKIIEEFSSIGYDITTQVLNAADYGVPQTRERVFIVGVRSDLLDKNNKFIFPTKTHEDCWQPLSIAIPQLDLSDSRYYFSERAVQGMKNSKYAKRKGCIQNLNAPCKTITSHLAKMSLNSTDPVLLVDKDKELYRRFTPREAARIQSFPETFVLSKSEATAYKQIGNAIPPVLFWHIMHKLISFLQKPIAK